MSTISDFLDPRDEVVEGRFQGVLQAHKVNDGGERLESNPDRLLSMTYPSNALETAFGHVDNKLRGRDSQGGITLSGPYGAGKSHGVLALYHLFEHPDIGQEWLDEWEIDLNLSEDSRATICPTRNWSVSSTKPRPRWLTAVATPRRSARFVALRQG